MEVAREWAEDVNKLEVSRVLLWPLAHWGVEPAKPGVYMLVIERETSSTFSVAVAAGGSALEYHAQSQRLGNAASSPSRLSACETMTVKHVSHAKIADPAFVFALLRLAAHPSPRHSYRVVYEVIIPFLESDSDSENLSMSRAHPSRTVSEYSVVPATPLSSVSCVLCHTVFRFLLTRYGVSIESIKLLKLEIRRALVAHATATMKQQAVLDGAERKGAEAAARSLAAAALRCLSLRLIDTDVAYAITRECDMLCGAVSEAAPCPYTQPSLFVWPEKEKENLLVTHRGGLATKALRYLPQTPQMLLEKSSDQLTQGSPPTPAAYRDQNPDYDALLSMVSDALSACVSIRQDADLDSKCVGGMASYDFATNAVIAARDIAAVVSRACHSLPSLEFWGRIGDDRRRKSMTIVPLLEGLLSLSMHMTSVVMSTSHQPQDTALMGTYTVTCAFLSAASDALVRGDGTQSLLSQFAVGTDSLAGASLRTVTGMLPLGPDDARLRSEVLCYWDRVKQQVSENLGGKEMMYVWDYNSLLGNPSSEMHPTYKLMSLLYEGGECDIETLSKTFIHTDSNHNDNDNEALPLPAYLICLRDVSVLAVNALVRPMYGIWVSPEKVRPVWESVVKSAGDAISVRLKCRVGHIALDSNEARQYYWYSIAESPKSFNDTSDMKRIADGEMPRGKGQLEEEGILYLPRAMLPSFACQVGSGEAERIISALTTPYIRIPMILGFLSSGHAGALSDSLCRVLVNAACFEPGPAPESGNVHSLPQSVPVDMSSLVTTDGLMAEENRHSASQIADCVIGILNDLRDAGAGDRLGHGKPSVYNPDPDDASGSSAFDALLFAVSLASRCEGYTRWIDGPSSEAADRIGAVVRGPIADALTAMIEVDANADARSSPSLAAIRVCMTIVESFRYAPADAVIQNAADLFGWMSLARAWLDRALTAESCQVSQLATFNFVAACQAIGAVIGPWLASDDVTPSERDALLSKAAMKAMTDMSGSEESIWKVACNVPLAWIKNGENGNLLAMPLLGSISMLGTTLQAVPHQMTVDPTFKSVFAGIDTAKIGCVPLQVDPPTVLMSSDGSQYVVRMRSVIKSGEESSELPSVHNENDNEFEFAGYLWARSTVDDVVKSIGTEPVDCIMSLANGPNPNIHWWLPMPNAIPTPYHVLVFVPKLDCWLGGTLLSRRSFEVNQFVEHDDGIWETPVFCSDGWRCIADLAIPLDTVKADYPHAPIHPGLPVLSKSRNARAKPRPSDADYVVDIWRSQLPMNSGWCVNVPSWKLEGLIPAALLNRFHFWRIGDLEDNGDLNLVGEAIDSDTAWSLTVQICHATNLVSIFRHNDNNNDKLRLLDLRHAKAGTVLGDLVETLLGIEQLGHILVWGPQLHPDEILLVELPRLNVTFVPNADAQDLDLRLSDDPTYHLVMDHASHPSLPWAVPLMTDEFDYDQRAWLVPNYRPIPRTDGELLVVLDADDGGKERAAAVKRAVYVYPEREFEGTLLPPSTAASLYLFVLHLYLQQYVQASALIPLISIDQFTPEETWIANLVGGTGTALGISDPSAAACRLQFYEISCVSSPASGSGSPLQCKWPILVDVWRYLQGYAHVPPQCRLSIDAERVVLKSVLAMVRPEHPVHRRAPVAGPDEPPEPLNRMIWSAKSRLASLNGAHHVQPVPFSIGGGWKRIQWSSNASLRELKEELMKGKGWAAKLAPPSGAVVSGIQTLDGLALESLWNHILETSPNDAANGAFLSIYTAFKSGSGSSVRWAELVSQWMYFDSQSVQNTGKMRVSWPRVSFMLLSAMPAMRPNMFPSIPPKLSLSTLRQKGSTRLWAVNLTEAAIVATSTREWRRFIAPLPVEKEKETGTSFPSSPSLVQSFCPPFVVSDAACDQVVVDLDVLGLEDPTLLRDAMDEWMAVYKRKPTTCDRDNFLPLPFDISHMPDAQTRLAAVKLDRMAREMKKIANDDLDDSMTIDADQLEERLDCVIKILQKTRDRDATALIELNAVIAEADVDIDSDDNGNLRPELKLLRCAGMGTKLTWKTVAIAMGSSRGLEELASAFPLLQDSQSVVQATVRILMLQSRRLLASRAIALARKLRLSVCSQRQRSEGEMEQTGNRLLDLLSTKRYHQHQSLQAASATTVDPRMLLLEFEAGIVLRKSQVELIRQFEQDAKIGSSRVQQMIMGQGKTSVVTPLLVLILAHSSRLVTVSVPPSLLVLSRSSLMATLGRGWGRRIFTVEYTRTPPPTVLPPEYARSLRETVQRARANSSPIVTTASSLKAIVLCFVEAVGRITDALPEVDTVDGNVVKDLNLEEEFMAAIAKSLKKQSESENRFNNKEASQIMDIAVITELAAVLRMFGRQQEPNGANGILLMDEVDVILHPLKSELNYPVGPTEVLDLFSARISLALRLVKALTVPVTVDDPPYILKSIQKVVDEGVESFQWTRSPHLTLVDRDGFDQLLEPLAQWIWPWFEHALDNEDMTETARIAKVTADSELDGAHTADRALGGEGTGFWCSAAKPKVVPNPQLLSDPDPLAQARDLQRQREARESELIIELESPCTLSAIEIAFVPLSSFFGASGQLMHADWTEVYAGTGNGWKHVGGGPYGQFHGTRVELPLHRTVVSHLKLKLQGDATWFAVRNIRVHKGPQLSHVPTNLREEVIEYLMSPQNSISMKLGQDRIPPRSMQLVNIARDVLQIFLPHVLSKKSRVEYGLLGLNDLAGGGTTGDRRFVSAVPFLGLDVPSPKSEFAHPDILILLTALAYRHGGLRQTDLVELVATMKQRLASEGGAVSARPTWLLFNEWIGPHAGMALHLLDPSDPEQMDLVRSSLSHNWSTIEWYLCEIVYPKIMLLHSTRLTATGEELGDNAIFGIRFGFSGTPNALLPRAMGPCHFELGTEGHILRTLSSSATVTVTSIRGKWDSNRILRAVATHDPPLLSLIDAGALMQGLSNQAVAETLLRFGLTDRGIRGVVFLDENDRPMVLLADGEGEGDVVPLGEDGIPPSKRFVYFDQIHTTGMDLPQAPHAIAAVLLGKSMTMRDYSQACWRMRGLGIGQKCCVFVVDEVSRLILRASGGIGPTPTQSDVIGWLVLNEIRSERIQANKLKSMQITTVSRRPAFAKLMRFADNLGNVNAMDLMDMDMEVVNSVRTYYGPPMSWMDGDTCSGPDKQVLEANLTGADVAELAEIDAETLEDDEPKSIKTGGLCGCIWPLFCQKKRYVSRRHPIADKASLDTEVQNEKEQEQEVISIDIKKIQPAWRMIERPEIPWPIEMLRSIGMENGGPFHPLSAFRVRHDVKTPAFPPWLLVTTNHTPTGVPASTSRLKNVGVVMVVVIERSRFVCVLSLREAATMRYLALHSVSINPRLKLRLALVDVGSGYVLQTMDSSSEHMVKQEPLSLSALERGMLKFFDCELEISQHEVDAVLNAFTESDDRAAFIRQLVRHRRRDWSSLASGLGRLVR